jgi:hypothetical protein
MERASPWVPSLAWFCELISSRVYIRLLRLAGTAKQTTGLVAKNNVI